MTLGPLLYHVLSLGLLFGRTPPPILVVPVGAGFTSGLAGSGRVLALPALCWPAHRDFLGEGDGLLQLTGFLSFGAPLDAVDLVRGPVLFGALVTSCLAFDGRLAAVSAEAEGLGLDEMLLLIEPFSFSSGLRCQRGSFLCGILRRGYFVGSLPFGVIGMCLLGTAFMLSGWDWDRESIDEKLSFRMVYACVCRATLLFISGNSLPIGLSLRVRGHLVGRDCLYEPDGLIPACAGPPNASTSTCV